MAERRMISKSIIQSDIFMDMPDSTQLLYIHLILMADDDGFVSAPRKIQRMCGAADDDLKILIIKGFVITFESGVVVLKHWKVQNCIQKDRYKPTIHTLEFSMLRLQKNREYVLGLRGYEVDTNCIQAGSNMDTQVSIGQDRSDEFRTGESNNTILYQLDDESLTMGEYQSLISEYPKTIIDKIINRVLTHPYSSCLNYQTISEWAAKTPTQTQTQNKGGRPYNYNDLEAQLLAAKPVSVPR